MAHLIWTQQAFGDLEKICEFIAEDSESYARLFALKVIASIEKLKLFPRSGRMGPEINRAAIREILLGDYRIIYRIKGDEIQIISVYHSARILTASSILKKHKSSL